MSIRGMLGSIIRSGHWAQCRYCRRAMPTKEWRQQCLDSALPSKLMRDSAYIEASGYCTECLSMGLKEPGE